MKTSAIQNPSLTYRAISTTIVIAAILLTILQTNPLWTRLALGRFGAAQHIVLPLCFVISYGFLAVTGPRRLVFWATIALLPIVMTLAGVQNTDKNGKLTLLAGCVDLLRIPAAVLLGGIFRTSNSPKLIRLLFVYIVAICAVNTVIALVESVDNSYLLEIPPELVTTTNNALDQSIGMEGEVRPRAACITPNGLASVLSFGFLVVIFYATLQRQRPVRCIALVLLALGIVAGIYWTTVRAAFLPALLVLFLFIMSRGPFSSLSFRRTTYLVTLVLVLTISLAGAFFATALEEQLRPYIGKIVASSSAIERNENWRNIQHDIIRNPEIGVLGIDLLGTGLSRRAHKSGICDNQFYYSIYHWGVFGFIIIAALFVLPFTKLYNDEKYGAALWLSSVFVVSAAAFTDEIYYLPTVIMAFLIGLSITGQYLENEEQTLPSTDLITNGY